MTKLCLLLLAVTSAFAQKWEVGVFGAHTRTGANSLGSFSTEKAADEDTKLTKGVGFGARVTLNTKGYYGHEFGYTQDRLKMESSYVPDGADAKITVKDTVKIHRAYYNFLIYFMPAGERFRPFITGGAQAAQYGAPNFALWDGGTKSRRYGGNWGGGLKINLAKHALFRIDARDYLGGKPYDLFYVDPTRIDGLFRHLEFSAGFSVTF